MGQQGTERHAAFLNGQEIHLTPMEYSLLLYLFKNQGKVVTTNELLRQLWGANYGQDTQALRTLRRVCAARSRRALRDPAISSPRLAWATVWRTMWNEIWNAYCDSQNPDGRENEYGRNCAKL